MSHSFSYSIDDDAFTAPSPAVVTSDEVRLRDRPPSIATTRQSNRHSGEWSTRLSTSGSTSSSSGGRRDTALPPTRQGVLKPEDTLKVDAFRLVKPESSPLSITAMETLSVLEKQKQAQKETTRTQKNTDDADIDWEQNLSSWKSRRKSKSSYQSKALEIGGDDDAEDSATATGKKSKTFKELMDDKEKRSNGHSTYTYENVDRPAVETLPAAAPSKRDTPPTSTDTKHSDLPKHSEPLSERAPTKESATGSHSTSRYNSTETSDREPRAASTRSTESHSSEVGYGTRANRSGLGGATEDSRAESHSSSRYNLSEAPSARPTEPHSSEVGYGTRANRSGLGGAAEDSRAESHSSSRYNLSEAPSAKSSDEESNPTSRQTTSEFVSASDRGTGTDHLSERSVTERKRDQEKSLELTVDLQVHSTKPSAKDPVEEEQKKKQTTTESVRPLKTEPEPSWKSSQAPSRQKSETYSAVKTTSAFEVQLREKPKGDQPVARPSSYAYTPSTRQPVTSSVKAETGRVPARTETKVPTGLSSNRDSLISSRQLDRTSNTSVADNTNRDRRVKSSFEMNFDKSFPRTQHKSVAVGGGDGGPSTSRFKQTLSMFQSKETEGGNVGPVKALPGATQRGTVGRISRLPAEDFKPSRSVVEMRRGSAAERKYQPETTSASYKTDAARLRGVSRSVQGLDMHRSEFDIPDVRYGSRNFGKSEVKSAANSIETSSSRAHSSDEEREKMPRDLSEKNPADNDRSLDARASTSVKSWRETPDNESHGKVIGKQNDLPQGSISVTRYSSIQDPGVNDKTTSAARRSFSTSTNITDIERKPELKSNEPKDLYAYKHRSPLMEESAIGERYTGKQTPKDIDSTRRQDYKYPETKSSHFESRKSEPAVRYDPKESYGRDEYKKPDAAPYRVSHHAEPEKTASGLLSQKSSISDIFSKRSAVIRGKPVTGETEPHFTSSVAPRVVESTQAARNPAEREMTRRLEAAVDDTINEFQTDRSTRTKNPSSAISDDVIDAKIKHDQQEPFRKTDYDVPRTSRDPYGSSRRHDGLERAPVAEDRVRTELEEPPSQHRVTLREEKSSHQPTFEVNFSVSEVDKQRGSGEHKVDKGNVENVAAEKDRWEEKSVRQQSAFELNFSVSELEKQRRSGEDKLDKGNVVEKEKHNANAELLRINDSVIIKTPKEEKRLTEDQETILVLQDKGISHDQKLHSGDLHVSLGDQSNTADSKKISHQPHDSFHRKEVTIGSVGRHDVDLETKTEKRTPTGDLEISKRHSNEFQIEIDTRHLLPDSKSSDKRIPAVSLSTEPKTYHSESKSEKTTSIGNLDSSKSHANEFQIAIDTKGLLHDRNSPEKRAPAVSLSTETKSEKTTPIRDWDSSKTHSNEFQIEIDTRGLSTGRSSPEKRIQAESLHTQPGTLHCGLQQELIVEFPESKFKESSKKEVKDTTHEFYFGMTSEEVLRPSKTGRPAEIVVEIPHPDERRQSPVDLLPSKEQKLPPQEHKLPPEKHTLPSHDQTLTSHHHELLSKERKLPTEGDKFLSQEPKADPKIASKENKLPPLEHKLSSLPSLEKKLQPEERKIPSPDHELPPYDKKLPTEAHNISPLEIKASSKEHKLPPEEHTIPSHDHNLSRDEHKMPPKEPKIPPSEHKLQSDEEKSSSLEHRLSSISSKEHKSREQKLPSEQPKLPSEQPKLPSQEEVKPSRLDRNSEIGHVIDLDKHPDVKAPAGNFSSDKAIIAELDTLLDGTRFDMNSNIPTDTKPKTSPSHSTLIFQDEADNPSSLDSSHDKTSPKITVVTTPVDRKRGSDEVNGFLASSAIDEGKGVSDSDAKSGPAPKKKPPAPPPKTKPKPPKVTDEPAAEKDDWGFLSSSQRLDVSANKDKCRLLTTAPMGAKRRPKSVMFPMLDSTDPFNPTMTTEQNGFSMEVDDHKQKLDGEEGDPSLVTAPAPVSAATRLRNKGIRPVSYMEELNSSLFKKKKLNEKETPSDDEETEPKSPSSTHEKMEVSEEQSKGVVRSSSSIRRRKEEDDGKREGPAEELESPGADKAKPGAQVKIPGLMDELNISLLKKKRPDNVRDSSEEEKNVERKPFAAEVATGDLLNFSDDRDVGDNAEEAPPPPLPNAPPPLPNWSAFPGSTSTDPLIDLPPGSPPRPPSGPPPPGQSLIDLSFSEDDPGQIHFRTTGLSDDQSHSQKDGSRKIAFQTDDDDFSFA